MVVAGGEAVVLREVMFTVVTVVVTVEAGVVVVADVAFCV